MEVAVAFDGMWVRSSVDPEGSALFFSGQAWRAFLIQLAERKSIKAR